MSSFYISFVNCIVGESDPSAKNCACLICGLICVGLLTTTSMNQILHRQQSQCVCRFIFEQMKRIGTLFICFSFESRCSTGGTQVDDPGEATVKLFPDNDESLEFFHCRRQTIRAINVCFTWSLDSCSSLC